MWGFKDGENFYNVAITGDGRFAVTRKENNRFFDFSAPQIPNPAVNQGNSMNTLTLEKEGREFEVFINGRLIHRMPFQPFFGQNIGFLLYNRIQIAVDNLIVATKLGSPTQTIQSQPVKSNAGCFIRDASFLRMKQKSYEKTSGDKAIDAKVKEYMGNISYYFIDDPSVST